MSLLESSTTLTSGSVIQSGAVSGVGLANREDVTDFVLSIDPTETPLLSTLKTTKANATYHEWLTKALASAAANSRAEGVSYVANTPHVRTRRGNYTQILNKVYDVTGTQQAVTMAGTKDLLAEEMVDAMKELKRDLNLALWQGDDTAPSTVNDPLTGRVMDGIITIIPTANTGTGKISLISTLTGDAAEGVFNSILQDIYDDGLKATHAFMLPSTKKYISRWDGVATKYFDQAEKKLVNVVDIYESDFGMIRFTMDRQMPAVGTGVTAPILVAGNFDNAKLAMLRPFETRIFKDQPRDAVSGVVQVECTLEYGHPNAYGKMLLT